MKTRIKYILILISITLIYLSCSEKRDPFSVTTHPEGWNSESSELFHGAVLLENNSNLENCQSCHGVDYLGGEIGVNCTSAGCHADPNGPEACNTCHGNEINTAPPKDLYGNIDSTFVGVGAHQLHLTDTTWTTAFQQDCNVCHKTPVSFSSDGHIDKYPYQAEVIFSSLGSGIGSLDPSWNHESETCDNIYCHGGFAFDSLSSAHPSAYIGSTIEGNNKQFKWTSSTGQVSCGSCHGLPPKGHKPAQMSECGTCHSSVVDANLNIINKELHINGEIEVF